MDMKESLDIIQEFMNDFLKSENMIGENMRGNKS